MQKLGQHFLKDKSVLKKITANLEIGEGDTIIEVGPGHGELTEELRIKNKEFPPRADSSLTGRIIAIEKDFKLTEYLKNKYNSNKEIEIVEGDALKILPSMIHNSLFTIHNWKLVGNIPYYITGHLLRVISELKQKPGLCVLTIQKEVAERIVAKPPRMNLLAASIQIWADPKFLFSIPPNAFNPPPKVQSAVIQLRIKNQELKINEKNYYKLIHILFKQPRKTILNNLADGLNKKKEEIAVKLKMVGMSPKNRPQNLSVYDIIKLSEIFYD